MLKTAVTRAVLAAAFVLAVISSVQADADLRWKFKEGQSLDYVMERGVEGKINLSGADIQFTLSMIFDTTWKVKAVAADGTAEVEQTITRVQVDMNSPLGGKLTYDSNSTEKPPAGPVWGQLEPVVLGLLNQTFNTKVSPLGAVTDIQLPAKLAENFAKQSKVGQNRQSGFGIGGNSFSEKGIKELITKSVLPLPEKVEKDTTWTQAFTNEMPGIGVQTAETTYSVTGPESVDGKDLIKIAGVTELTFEPAENPRAELEITSQEASAAFYFDVTAGHMVKSSGTQNMGMELSGPQELTQEIKETVTMRMGKSPEKKPAAEVKKEEKKDDKKTDAKK